MGLRRSLKPQASSLELRTVPLSPSLPVPLPYVRQPHPAVEPSNGTCLRQSTMNRAFPRPNTKPRQFDILARES